MQFYIGKKTLEPELSTAQSILDRKAQIPILDNILIISDGHNLRLHTTNLDTSLISTIVADQITEQGTLCLPARRLYDIVRQLPDGIIQISSEDNHWARINVQKSKYRIPGADPADFPRVEELESAPSANFSAKLLKKMISGVEYAMAPEEHAQYTLRGVKFESDASGLRMVAADGHRLSLASGETEELQLEDLDLLIPEKALTYLSKMCSEMEGGEIEIAVEDKRLSFSGGNRVLLARRMVGDFPQYQRIFEKVGEEVTDILFQGTDLLSALRRITLTADSHSYAVLFDFGSDTLKLRARTQQTGEGEEEIDVTYGGEPFKMNLNAKYLLDFLEELDSATIHFGVKNAVSPVLLSGEKNNLKYGNVVMPMQPPEE